MLLELRIILYWIIGGWCIIVKRQFNAGGDRTLAIIQVERFCEKLNMSRVRLIAEAAIRGPDDAIEDSHFLQIGISSAQVALECAFESVGRTLLVLVEALRRAERRKVVAVDNHRHSRISTSEATRGCYSLLKSQVK